MSKQLKVILFLFLFFSCFSTSAFSLTYYYPNNTQAQAACVDFNTTVGWQYCTLQFGYYQGSIGAGLVYFRSTSISCPAGTSISTSNVCESLPSDCTDTSTPEVLVRNTTSDGGLVIYIGEYPKLYKDGCEYEQIGSLTDDSCYYYNDDIMCSSSYVKTGADDSALPPDSVDGLTSVSDLPDFTDSIPLDLSPDPAFDVCFSPVSDSEVCRPVSVDPVDPNAAESCWLVNGSKTCSYGFEDFVDAGYVPLDDPLLQPKNCVRSDSGAISCIEVDPAQADFKLVMCTK